MKRNLNICSGTLRQLMLGLPDGFEGKVYLDSADVVDLLLGLGYTFVFETWIDSSANKRSTALCSSEGKQVQSPRDLPIIVKHEFRVAARGDLGRQETALRRAVSGVGSLPGEAFEILHAAYSLDGLSADIFTKALPHLLNAHRYQLPVIAAAASRCIRSRWFARANAACLVLGKYLASALVRNFNRRVMTSTMLIWGKLQRSALRLQYSSMLAAITIIDGYLRKNIVFWEVARRCRATDVVIRKFRRRQRWLAWRKFVASMNQIRVLIQRLLPYTRMLRWKQQAAYIQW
jgi:hypothetical protein